MVNFMGGVCVVATVDRKVTYADVEAALAKRFTNFLINRSETPEGTELTLSIHSPMITELGAIPLDAVATLRDLADALADLH